MTDDAERKAFEEWFEAAAMPLESNWFRKDEDGDYAVMSVAHAWDGWKARAALNADTETVERVARALCRADGHDPDDPAYARYPGPGWRDKYVALARAALTTAP